MNSQWAWWCLLALQYNTDIAKVQESKIKILHIEKTNTDLYLKILIARRSKTMKSYRNSLIVNRICILHLKRNEAEISKRNNYKSLSTDFNILRNFSAKIFVLNG